MWLIDRLFNRKIEGKSSLDNLQPLAEKVEYEGDNVKLNGTLSAKNVVEEGDTELIELGQFVFQSFAKSNSFYAKLLIKHGVLHIILSGKFVAGTSASTNPSIVNNIFSILPEGIADKIYRADGTKITEEPSTTDWENAFVASTVSVKRVGGTISTANVILRSVAINTLRIDGYGFGTIAEDANCLLDVRIALTI